MTTRTKKIKNLKENIKIYKIVINNAIITACEFQLQAQKNLNKTNIYPTPQADMASAQKYIDEALRYGAKVLALQAQIENLENYNKR